MKLLELSRELAVAGVKHLIVADPWEVAMSAAVAIAQGEDPEVVLAGFRVESSDMKLFKHSDLYWSKLLRNNKVKCDDTILLGLVQDLYLQYARNSKDLPDNSTDERDFAEMFVIDSINKIKILCQQYKAAATTTEEN